MRDPQQKQFMKNYYAMSLGVMLLALGIKLSGYLAAFFAALAVLVVTPSLNIANHRLRWLIYFLTLALTLLFMPSLEGLKNSPG